MRLLRHPKAIAFVFSVCLLMGLVPGSRLTAAARAVEPIETVKKTIDGFGTSVLQNPGTADGSAYWRGNYVYFGTYDEKPIRFRVLSKSTTDFGGTTMLLDSEMVLWPDRKFGGTQASPVNTWADSDLKAYLNGDFWNTRFTPGEQNAVVPSTKSALSASDGKVAQQKGYLFAPLTGERIFVLDAAEATNTSYGYMQLTNSLMRPLKKLGTSLTGYWLRSYQNNQGSPNAVYVTNALAIGGDGPYFIKPVSPALNMNPSSILFLSQVEDATEGYSWAAYKMTLKDSDKSISVPSGQDVTYTADGVVTVPYTYTDSTTVDAQKVNRISVLITRQELTGSDNPAVLYYGALEDIRDAQGNTSSAASAQTGSGTFTLPADLRGKTLGTDYYLYILPEHVNVTTRQKQDYFVDGEPTDTSLPKKALVVSCATDYAGDPVKIMSMRPAHTHSFAYTQSGSEIRAYCTNTQQADACSYQQSASALRLVLTAGDMTYSGSTYSRAAFTNSISAVTGAHPGSLYYEGTGSTSYAKSDTAPTNAGTYQASVTLGGKTAVCAFTIQKAAPGCMPPVGLQPEYTGSAQALIFAGSATGGRMEYSLDGQTWSQDIPTATEVGSYTVYYRVIGDRNHTDLAAASVTAKIRKMTQTGISAADAQVDYDGQPHGITVSLTDSTGVTVWYGASADACDQTSLTYKNAGVYTIYYKAVKENAEDYTGSAKLTIQPVSITIRADDAQKVYGESDPASFSYAITSGKLVGEEQLTGITVARAQGETVRTAGYPITPSQPDGANPNYKIKFEVGTFTIHPKTIGIQWGNTALTYNGTLQTPEATAVDVISGDAISLKVGGAQRDAGEGYTATVTGITGERAGCYALPQSGLSTAFSIVKAGQNAPIGVKATDETIAGRHDGILTGVAAGMEYRRVEDSAYTAITGTQVTGLAPGQYVVRYAADGNHHASADCPAVEIRKGRQLTVTLPETMTGYTLTADPMLLDWHGRTTLTFALQDGYAATGSFSITDRNGAAVTLTDGKYVVSNAEKDVVIVVNGVADIAAPKVEISVQENRWSSFLSTITFNLFFRQTQTVTITVPDADKGSGLQSLHYHVADHALSLSEVQALAAADWTPYTAPFVMEKERAYVIYARAVDRAGNTAYVSSDGMIIDKTVPEIADLKDGAKYYGEVTFTAGDSYLKRVEIDGTEAKPDGNGLYRILPDNGQHTVAAEDEAGNRTQIAIWVYRIYTVTYVADGVTVSTQQIGYGQNATPPSIPPKEGFDETPPRWDHDGTNITADTTITAIYTKNDPGVIADDSGSHPNYGQAVLGNSPEALRTIVPLTPEEQRLLELGWDISLWIEAEDISGTVSAQDRTLVETRLKGGRAVVYLDVRMFKQVADRTPVQLTGLNAPVTITLTLPGQLLKTREGVIRSWQVVRVHNGRADVIEATHQGNALSFRTDRFSTYALICRDSVVDLPQTGDDSHPGWWLALLAVSTAVLLALCGSRRRRAQKN